MPRRADPNAACPPGGWEVWLNAVDMNRRRAAQRAAEDEARRAKRQKSTEDAR